MPLELPSAMAHERLIQAYDRRHRFEGPKLWQLRAKILEASTMPKTVQRILGQASYVSPETVRILDIGCGRGYKNDLIIRSIVTPTAKKIEIVGCDLMDQPEHIEPSDPRAAFSFRIVPAERILEEFGPESFDAVTGIAVHHHFGNIVSVAAQVQAVLKPRGVHLIADNFCWSGNALSKVCSQAWIQLYRWCEGNGFYNEASCADVLCAQRKAHFDILGTFRAPLFVEGILARKM